MGTESEALRPVPPVHYIMASILDGRANSSRNFEQSVTGGRGGVEICEWRTVWQAQLASLVGSVDALESTSSHPASRFLQELGSWVI